MGRNKEAMIAVHEKLKDQLSRNKEEAAQNLRRQGPTVDCDELAWDSASTVEDFVSQDPDKLVETAGQALELGMITQEIHDEMLRDAELIRRVQRE